MKFIFQLNYYKIDNIFCKNYIEIKTNKYKYKYK